MHPRLLAPPMTRPLRAAARAATLALLAAFAPSAVKAQRVDSLLAAMTLDEKLSFLHGARDPQPTIGLNSAGYIPGVPRLGIPPLRLTDGPAGIRTAAPATALPAPVALAASFDTALARRYGQVLGREGRARNQDVLLSPMVNIVRVPEGGRNFETLGEDPLLAASIVGPEIAAIQREGLIATVKHYAANNFEKGRQGVDVIADERTLHEIYLPAFESAVKAGVGAVMCSYNRVNGTQACDHRELLTGILRDRFGFDGWVMTDWFAFHGREALGAGLDQEMPGFNGRGPRPSVWFADSLRVALADGRASMTDVDRAVRRILVQMDRFGLLGANPPARPALDSAAGAAVARDAAIEGAVLLRNERGTLPIARTELATTVVIGPTARTPLVGGGGSAHVQPLRATSLLAALGRGTGVQWRAGVDLDGVAVPAAAFTQTARRATGITRTSGAPGGSGPALAGTNAASVDSQIDFTAGRALPVGSAWTWSGAIAAPASGEYDLRLQTRGGRGTLVVMLPSGDTARVRTGELFSDASLIPTADGLQNATITLHLDRGRPIPVVVIADARPTPMGMFSNVGPEPLQVRLAWSTPARRQRFVREAVAAARTARHVIVVAHDEGSEGADRTSLALPAHQDTLIAALTHANPRTAVVLQTGSAVAMPWIASAGAVLEAWYPGEEGGEAVAAMLTGEATPSGHLPVTFPRRASDAPTSDSTRYPGVRGRVAYSEGVLVGYRWYDARGIAPLFPFGHGLSYTRFAYDSLAIISAGDGWDVRFTIRNVGSRAGAEVAQVYLAPPASAPVSMAKAQLAGFAHVSLAPGEARTVTVHLDRRALSYWSESRHDWVVVSGARAVAVGSSSRDVRLRGAIEPRE